MKLKWDDHGIKTPLARAKGLGSAGHAVGHWMNQRVTAIANIPLVIWFVLSFVSLQGASHAEFSAWLSEPLNTVLAILFIISTFYHAVLGSQVVVEDYVHNEAFKTLKLIGNKLFFFALGVASIVSILKISFGA